MVDRVDAAAEEMEVAEAGATVVAPWRSRKDMAPTNRENCEIRPS